jgi:hypothetical protein
MLSSFLLARTLSILLPNNILYAFRITTWLVAAPSSSGWLPLTPEHSRICPSTTTRSCSALITVIPGSTAPGRSATGEALFRSCLKCWVGAVDCWRWVWLCWSNRAWGTSCLQDGYRQGCVDRSRSGVDWSPFGCSCYPFLLDPDSKTVFSPSPLVLMIINQIWP